MKISFYLFILGSTLFLAGVIGIQNHTIQAQRKVIGEMLSNHNCLVPGPIKAKE
jgi:hypothetical protein